MHRIVRSNQFKKDVKRLSKSGSKNMSKLKEVIVKLIEGEKLDKKYRNHPLTNNWKGCLECHIEPDWLLIYRINQEKKKGTATFPGNHLNNYLVLCLICFDGNKRRQLVGRLIHQTHRSNTDYLHKRNEKCR